MQYTIGINMGKEADCLYRHTTFFWLKDCTQKNLDQAASILRHMVLQVHGVLSAEIEEDILRRDHACHLSLTLVFATRQALEAYYESAAYRTAEAKILALSERHHVADNEVTRPVRRMPSLYAFIGPSNRDAETLGALLDAGMTGIRLSLLHHTAEECLPIIDALLKEAAKRSMTPQILLDPAPDRAFTDDLDRCSATGVILSVPLQEEALQNLRRMIGQGIRLFAKVDCTEDLDTLPLLLTHADELILARGGLTRSVPRYDIPATQKRIASLCHHAGKPFMVATGLLASMKLHPTASAAELSDIYNAVHDGASSLMLTQEVSVGPYPLEAMETLRRAAQAAL